MMLRQKGFSLVELVIALAILAILASIAYSSYSSQVQKSRRTDVTEALLKAAALQERFFLSNTPNRYAAQLDINEIGGTSTENGFYTISTVNDSASGTGCAAGSCFTVTGTVVNGGAQANDSNCQRFTIDNLGRKRAYNSADALSDNCW